MTAAAADTAEMELKLGNWESGKWTEPKMMIQ
jgi:hypothetical protein